MSGWEASTVPATIQAWFTQFQTNPLLGLRNLDLLNVTISPIDYPHNRFHVRAGVRGSYDGDRVAWWGPADGVERHGCQEAVSTSWVSAFVLERMRIAHTPEV
jgi:hypothetical protein